MVRLFCEYQSRPRKRALSASDDAFPSISNPAIKRARRRVLSHQLLLADRLTQKKRKTILTVLNIGDNVKWPLPSVYNGPTDVRNIRGVKH